MRKLQYTDPAKYQRLRKHRNRIDSLHGRARAASDPTYAKRAKEGYNGFDHRIGGYYTGD